MVIPQIYPQTVGIKDKEVSFVVLYIQIQAQTFSCELYNQATCSKRFEMSEILSCSECDKSFGNMVKLKEHMKIHHLLTKDLLRVEWTDEEKVNYFSTLTIKLIEVEEKVKEYDNKNKSLEQKLEVLNLNYQLRKEILIQRPKSNGGKPLLQKVPGSYEDVINDPTIPENWKSASQVRTVYKGGTRIKKVYWAPDGRFFPNCRDALYYLWIVLGGSKEDVEQMKEGLNIEGWEKAKDLPKDWMAKRMRDNKHGHHYLTPDFEFCRNKMKALQYLLKTGSDEEISLFVTKKFISQEVVLGPFKWLESHLIPRGWKVGVTKTKKLSRKKFFITPEGHVLSRKKTLQEVLLKTANFNKS